MTLFNEICDNCIYGAKMPIICAACGGIVRGGLCLPCDLREKNLYNCDPNAYSFNNSNYFPQLRDENYLCNLCGNNSHDDYDCQQQFPFVYEQEPSYNQNYDDNYYPHESLSFPFCDYYGGSHETFQCQPDNQNVDFSGSDQIQTPQYPDVNPPSPEIKYDQSTSTDRPIFLNDNEDHPVQNKESIENSSEETVVSKTNQEPPQDLDIHQLIEECSVEVLEQQKQKMEDTIVIRKSSISFKNTSQISSIHSIAPIQSTKEPEHLLSMGYEHLSITPKTESDEVTESNAENLLPIPRKFKVTLEDETECDMPAKDVYVPAEEFKIYSNPLCDEDEINSDKLDPHCFNVESDFVKSLLNRDTFINFSSKFDFSGELAHIKPEIPKFDFDFEEEIRLIENLLYDNSFPRPPEELNAEIDDTIIESIPLLPIPVQDGNSQQEEIDIFTEIDDVLPLCVKNDDDSSDDPLLGEADLFLFDDSIPPGIKIFADDPEGDIHFLEELLIDDSILSHESSDSNFEENQSNSRPPPEPHDDNSDLEPEVISAVMEDIDEPNEYFNPGGEIFVSTNNEDVDYFPFIFVIRFFLPYFIFPEISPLFLFAESEDTIFDPGLSPEIEVILCWIYVRFPRSSYPLIDFSLGREELAEYIDSPIWNCPTFYYDEDEEYTIQYREYLEKSPDAVTTILPTEEPEHSLSMGYEHLSTIPETESDKVIESNAENLLPIPSKREVTLKDEIKCDMPVKDVCSPVFTIFSNPLFKDNENFDSSDDESLPDEDIPAEEFKIYSNPLCDEDEINSNKLDPHFFNVEY
nr:hypothetical protein [Tanacetum cinerariifolium]